MKLEKKEKKKFMLFYILQSCFIVPDLLTTLRCSSKCRRLIVDGQNFLHAIQPKLMNAIMYKTASVIIS